MFDIDQILGNKKKSKPIGNTAFNLLGGNTRHFAVGDRITKKQRVMIRRDPFGNIDGDFVINGLDCQPRNKRKHAYVPELNHKGNVKNYSEWRFRGESVPDKVTLYHGTRESNLKQIQEKGLLPQTKTKNVNFGNIADKYADKVYLAQNKGTAMYWAANSVAGDGEAIVVAVDVPKKEYLQGLKTYKDRARNDPMVKGETRDEVIVNAIPASNIKKVIPYSDAIIEKEQMSENKRFSNYYDKEQSRQETAAKIQQGLNNLNTEEKKDV
jgi:hypothetical protein